MKSNVLCSFSMEESRTGRNVKKKSIITLLVWIRSCALVACQRLIALCSSIDAAPARTLLVYFAEDFFFMRINILLDFLSFSSSRSLREVAEAIVSPCGQSECGNCVSSMRDFMQILCPIFILHTYGWN